MVYTCCVCKWRGNREPRRSFHKFPSDENVKKKWLAILEKNNTVLGARAVVCSFHFEKNCFHYGEIMERTLLKEGSLPSLYLPATSADSSLQKENESSNIESDICESSNKNEASTSENFINCEENNMKRPGKIIEDEIPRKQICLKNSLLVKSAANDLTETIQLQLQYTRKQLEEKNKKIWYLNRLVRRLRQSKLKIKCKQLHSKNTKQKKNLMHSRMERISKAIFSLFN